VTRLASPESDAESSTADRIRDRGERVRRRELDTALRRLRERGEVSPAERRILATLAARLADALVEQWAAKLDDGEVDPETALALLAE
jgi:glutamyl-tRNA reductase